MNAYFSRYLYNCLGEGLRGFNKAPEMVKDLGDAACCIMLHPAAYSIQRMQLNSVMLPFNLSIVLTSGYGKGWPISQAALMKRWQGTWHSLGKRKQALRKCVKLWNWDPTSWDFADNMIAGSCGNHATFPGWCFESYLKHTQAETEEYWHLNWQAYGITSIFVSLFNIVYIPAFSQWLDILPIYTPITYHRSYPSRWFSSSCS